MLVLTVIFCAIALLGDQCSAVPYKTGENKPKNICDYIYTQFEINFEEVGLNGFIKTFNLFIVIMDLIF